MKSKVYLYQFLILFIWIGVVILLFKFISEKQLAALFAGIGFIVWPTLFFIFEIRQVPNQMSNRIHLFILGFFILCNALPIFLMRVFNWGIEFSTLSFAGISANRFHSISNGLYLLMMLSSVVCFMMSKKNEKTKIQ